MTEPRAPEIDVEETMQKIREEILKKNKVSRPETHQETRSQLPETQMIENHSTRNSFDHLLWKYGKKGKKIVKKIPFLKDIARRQHSRLVRQFIDSYPAAQQSPPAQINMDVLPFYALPYYINYHGFLQQAKKQEGLKGRIKSFLFKFIRFFAWWQEQINRSLHQELVNQKTTIGWVQEQVNSLKRDLHERDKLVEDLSRRLVRIGQAGDELLRELGGQKNRIEELTRELTLQKEKLLRAERDTPNLLSQGMNTLKLEFTRLIESTRNELSGFPEVKFAIHHMTEEIRDHKLELLLQERRLTLLLEEAKKRFPRPMGPNQIKNMLKEEDHLLDAMYVAFENRFRGTREEIKERLKVYLPYVERAPMGEGGSPVLDLGCGRGEWLELLRENGYPGKGVDFNRGMVRQCQQFGLDVTESDMMEYLRNQPSDSFAALTGFHIVEHLSFKTLLSLFDEALRVLKSGGMAIFETPNPENLIVGACNFYSDPTHRNPVPPPLLNFLVTSRGFEKTEIIRLHPYEFVQGQQNLSTSVEAIISLFNKEQDYSVIGYKG